MGPLFYHGNNPELSNAPKRAKLAQWNFDGEKPEKVESGQAVMPVVITGGQVWTDSFTLGMTDEASAFPVFYSSGTLGEEKLLEIINSCSRRVGGSDYLTASDGVNWILSDDRFYLHNYTITAGQSSAMDSSNPESYTPGDTTWKDLSGSGNDLTLNPTVEFDDDGGGSFVFDGEDGTGMYTDASANQYDIVGDITMEGWIKLTPKFNSASTTKPIVFNKENAYEMAIDRDNGYLDWAIWPVTVGGWYWRGIPSVDLRDNKWHHIVVTRNLNGNEVAYVDGNQVVTHNGPAGNIKEVVNRVNIAGRGGGTSPNSNLPGKVGDIKVYNRVLSPSEVEINFKAGKARFNK